MPKTETPAVHHRAPTLPSGQEPVAWDCSPVILFCCKSFYEWAGLDIESWALKTGPPTEGKGAIKPYPSAHRTGLSPLSKAAGVGEQASIRSPGLGEEGSAHRGRENVSGLPSYRISWVFYNDVVARGCSALTKQFMSGSLIALERCGAAPGSRLLLRRWVFSILAKARQIGLDV